MLLIWGVLFRTTTFRDNCIHVKHFKIIILQSIPQLLRVVQLLRQNDAWHCIVLASDNNTVQKHNN